MKENGFVNIIEAGRIKAVGLTQSQLEDAIFAKLIENDGNRNFELSITGFNSKDINCEMQIILKGVEIYIEPNVLKRCYIQPRSEY